MQYCLTQDASNFFVMDFNIIRPFEIDRQRAVFCQRLGCGDRAHQRQLRQTTRIELGPLSYGIYVYMQSAVGRGAGAALGVVAIVLVFAGTWLVNRLTDRGAGAAFRV